MSAKLMGMVFDLKLPPSSKLVLASLCDHAKDDGTCVFPSMATTARRTSLSRRQVQRIVHSLIEQSFVFLVRNAYGGAKGQTRQYRINIPKFKECVGKKIESDIMSPASNKTPTDDASDYQAVTSETCTDDTVVTQTINDSSIKSSIDIVKDNKRTSDDIDIAYKERLITGGMTVGEINRWFSRAVFQDNGRVILVPTQFIAGRIHDYFDGKLRRGFGFMPEIRVMDSKIL